LLRPAVLDKRRKFRRKISLQVQKILHTPIDIPPKMCRMICIPATDSFWRTKIMVKFTDGELEVMRILWEHGEMKPAEIQEVFPRSIKNAALRSFLTILVEKGHVTRRAKGKAFYYRAKTPQESTFRSMLGDLVDTFCGGSSEALLCHLLAEEKLSEKELLELRRMAQEERGESRSSGTSTNSKKGGKSKS